MKLMLSVSRTHLLCLCVQQDVPSLRHKFLGHCWDLAGCVCRRPGWRPWKAGENLWVHKTCHPSLQELKQWSSLQVGALQVKTIWRESLKGEFRPLLSRRGDPAQSWSHHQPGAGAGDGSRVSVCWVPAVPSDPPIIPVKLGLKMVLEAGGCSSYTLEWESSTSSTVVMPLTGWTCYGGSSRTRPKKWDHPQPLGLEGRVAELWGLMPFSTGSWAWPHSDGCSLLGVVVGLWIFKTWEVWLRSLS